MSGRVSKAWGIVFVALAGLVLAPGPASAQTLTNDAIAFESGRGGGKLDIFTINGGPPVNLTDSEDHFDRDPHFAPDGKIIFERASESSPFGIWEMPGSGGTPTPILTDATKDYSQPAVSPDGSKILVVEDSNDVAVINRDGSGFRLIHPGRKPAFAPDGNLLAYAFNGRIDLMSLDGTVDRTGFDPPPGEFADWPSFSPDGSQLVFTLSTDAGDELWMAATDGSSSGRVDVTGLPGAPGLHEPLFSPDGTQILFSGQNSTGSGGNQLYTVPVNGGSAALYAGGAATAKTDSESGIDGDRAPDWLGVPDSTPPETELTSTPEDSITSDEATTELSYGFAGTDDVTAAGDLSFECSDDGGSTFAACSSPHTVTVETAGGPHEFQVRAIDAASNIDPSPASHTVTTEFIDCPAVAAGVADRVETEQQEKASGQAAKSKKVKKKAKKLAKKAKKAGGKKAKKLKQKAKKLKKKAKKLKQKAAKTEAAAPEKGAQAEQEALTECRNVAGETEG